MALLGFLSLGGGGVVLGSRLSASLLVLVLSCVAALGSLRRWCRAGVRPGGGCAGVRRGCPLLRLPVIVSGGRCAWVRASPRGFAPAPAWVSALAARGSGAAPLTVGGVAASACPPAGSPASAQSGLPLHDGGGAFVVTICAGRLSSAAWIHGGRGVPLSRLRCSVFGRLSR